MKKILRIVVKLIMPGYLFLFKLNELGLLENVRN